jgi:hypothetical protein
VIDFNILAGNLFSCFSIQKNTGVKNPEGKVMENDDALNAYKKSQKYISTKVSRKHEN